MAGKLFTKIEQQQLFEILSRSPTQHYIEDQQCERIFERNSQFYDRVK